MTGVVTITIFGKPSKTAGSKTEMDSEFDVVSIDIVREVNRVPYAQIVLMDGDAAPGSFAISKTTFFNPGAEIEIQLRYEDETQSETVFIGLVTGHRIEAGPSSSYLTVDLRDAAFAMTRTRKTIIFREKTDDKIITQLIGDNTLKKGKVAATKTAHPEIVQYNVTDWDFMLMRADANGLVVTSTDGEISVAEYTLSGSASLTIEYGLDEIFAFDLEIDGRDQVAEVTTLAWDAKQQKLTKETKAAAFKLGQGNQTGDKLATALGIAPAAYNIPAQVDPKELQGVADATVIRSRMSMFRGRFTLPGDSALKLLEIVELSSFGPRFDGKALVTGLRHRIEGGEWVSDIQVGLPADAYAYRPDILAPPASGLLPAMSGLHIGLVDQFEADPDKELRVKVILPGIDEKLGAVWARLASLDAGQGRGLVFRPEPGDEVVVGFFNDDPRQAVILGALFGSKNTLPDGWAAPSADNLEKGIVSRTGLSVKFVDDEKPMLVIETPAKNTLTFDDNGEMIEIVDQSGNTITMSADGVIIKSAADFTVEASGNVTIKGSAVEIQ